MKKEEAIKIAMSKFPNREIGKVTETEQYFLVELHSRKINPKSQIRPVSRDDGLVAVEKSTKKVFTYNPIRHGR